jgi:GAF domain-containing protein
MPSSSPDAGARASGALASEGASAADRANTARLVRLLDALASASGDCFVESLAAGLCETCGVDWAVISRIDPAAPDVAHTRALCRRGEQLPNITYSLAGTPCENAIRNSFCWYPTGVQAEFPTDTALVEMGVDSYMGTALFATTGELIGVMNMMHAAPIADPAVVEAILRAVANRVGAELERERAQRELRERERLLGLSQRAGRVGSWELDLSTRLARWSDEMFRLHGLGPSATPPRSSGWNGSRLPRGAAR